MKKTFTHICTVLTLSLLSVLGYAQNPVGDFSQEKTIQIANPYLWSDFPDPDIIRVGDYYYLVTTTMHMFPGGPIMRSNDLVHWEVVSYLFDSINDTPNYDMEGGTVYGRGQWATTIRYHKGTFWALFVANDRPHKSMVFKTDDPAKGWTLHSRLPAYHDASLFFDDDDRVYVYWGSGDISVVELNADLTEEIGPRKKLVLKDRPEGLHEGSRVVKHDGMYYLLNISWPRTGRQQLAYRSATIDGPYEMHVILKSGFGGFPYAGQGTIVDGKHGEWYGIIFQDRGGVGRILTIEPCSWIDGWPVLGTRGDGLIPDSVSLRVSQDAVVPTSFPEMVKRDYQWNHNYIAEAIKTETGSLTQPGRWVELTAAKKANSIFDARNTITWRTWGPTCTDTVCFDIRGMKAGDKAGLAAFNGDAGVLCLERTAKGFDLVFGEENVQLGRDMKEITDVQRKELERVKVPGSKAKDIRLVMNGDFRPGAHDMATFHYSIDAGKTWHQIGQSYQMRFDYRRLFMGTRYAVFYYSTQQTGGKIKVTLPSR